MVLLQESQPAGYRMIAEPVFECPHCKAKTEIMGDGHSNVRVCPECATLAWENEDGTTQTRRPQQVVE